MSARHSIREGEIARTQLNVAETSTLPTHEKNGRYSGVFFERAPDVESRQTTRCGNQRKIVPSRPSFLAVGAHADRLCPGVEVRRHADAGAAARCLAGRWRYARAHLRRSRLRSQRRETRPRRLSESAPTRQYTRHLETGPARPRPAPPRQHRRGSPRARDRAEGACRRRRADRHDHRQRAARLRHLRRLCRVRTRAHRRAHASRARRRPGARQARRPPAQDGPGDAPNGDGGDGRPQGRGGRSREAPGADHDDALRLRQRGRLAESRRPGGS
jgi:hypothetical protein